jgi:hypothetical protein
MEEGKLSSKVDMNVYFDDTSKPGPKALRSAVRRAALESSSDDYSRAIFKRIVREMKGSKLLRFRKHEEEVSTGELGSALLDLYKEERFMLQARPRDVYFEVPSHPGTEAWVRAVRQVVVKHGTSEYCNDVYKENKKRLYNSSFYINEREKPLRKAKSTEI